MRSGTDVGAIRPGSHGVEVRALCRPVKFFHTDLDKRILYGPLCAWGHCHHAETGKGLPHTVATKSEAQNCLECVL